MASTILVDTIQDTGGNTILQSNGSGVFTGSLTNKPNFLVTRTTSQTVSDNVKTKIEWDNEVYDTDSAFASDKFTVPAGQAGKYFLYIAVDIGTSGSYGVLNPRAYVYKNGTSIYYFHV